MELRTAVYRGRIYPEFRVRDDGLIVGPKGPVKNIHATADKTRLATVNFAGGLVNRGAIVLETFVGPRPEGYVMYHGPDPDPFNCSVSNLSWQTDAKNREEANARRTRASAKPRVLTAEDIPVIRALLADGVKQFEIAKQFGVSRTQINNIHRGIRWASV